MENRKLFDDPKIARVMAAQLFVAKNISRNPAKMIKFILQNKEYFPTVTNDIISKLMSENNVSQNDIDNEVTIQFSEINQSKTADSTKQPPATELKARVNLKQDSFTPNQVKINDEWINFVNNQ